MALEHLLPLVVPYLSSEGSIQTDFVVCNIVQTARQMPAESFGSNVAVTWVRTKVSVFGSILA
jgi:hypothetical protein